MRKLQFNGKKMHISHGILSQFYDLIIFYNLKSVILSNIGLRWDMINKKKYGSVRAKTYRKEKRERVNLWAGWFIVIGNFFCRDECIFCEGFVVRHFQSIHEIKFISRHSL